MHQIQIMGVFDLRSAWVLELRDKGQVETVAIPRKENAAESDILYTHCLFSGNFNKEVVGHIQNCQNQANWLGLKQSGL